MEFTATYIFKDSQEKHKLYFDNEILQSFMIMEWSQSMPSWSQQNAGFHLAAIPGVGINRKTFTRWFYFLQQNSGPSVSKSLQQA
jgi:hypothetical protein